MTIEIDKALAFDLLRDVVQGREEFVYEAVNGKCVYQQAGQPSCLVGHALAKAGVGAWVLALLDNDGGFSFGADDKRFLRTLRKHGVILDDGAIAAFANAQATQDDGHSWGEALDSAERYTLGDIGEEQEEIEALPLETPAEAPVEPAPQVEPEPEKVGV